MQHPVLKIAAWSALATIVFVTVCPIGLRPADILPTNVDRALAFAVMCGMFVLAYPRRWRWALLAAVLAPGMIEVLQIFSPTRHAAVDDAVVKSIGGLAGVFSGLAMQIVVRELALRRTPVASPSYRVSLPIEPSMMAMPVKSKMIQSVHFSQADGRLRIAMNDGRERIFEGVTESDAVALTEAPSPGAYYVNDFRKRFKRAA